MTGQIASGALATAGATKKSGTHTLLFVLGMLLLIVALAWVVFFVMALFVRKGDLWGGVLLDPKTHEESRSLNVRREERLKRLWPAAAICLTASVALFTAFALVQ